MTEWKAEPFGRDCLGNPSGYKVLKHGCGQYDTIVADMFIGNIYETGTHEKARQDAEALAESLNRRDAR